MGEITSVAFSRKEQASYKRHSKTTHTGTGTRTFRHPNSPALLKMDQCIFSSLSQIEKASNSSPYKHVKGNCRPSIVRQKIIDPLPLVPLVFHGWDIFKLPSAKTKAKPFCAQASFKEDAPAKACTKMRLRKHVRRA